MSGVHTSIAASPHEYAPVLRPADEEIIEFLERLRVCERSGRSHSIANELLQIKCSRPDPDLLVP